LRRVISVQATTKLPLSLQTRENRSRRDHATRHASCLIRLEIPLGNRFGSTSKLTSSDEIGRRHAMEPQRRVRNAAAAEPGPRCRARVSGMATDDWTAADISQVQAASIDGGLFHAGVPGGQPIANQPSMPMDQVVRCPLARITKPCLRFTTRCQNLRSYGDLNLTRVTP